MTYPPLNFAVLGLLDRKLALARAVRNGTRYPVTLNEEVAYKRGLGRPEMKFIYAKSKHGGTNLVHNHRVRRACMVPRPY